MPAARASMGVRKWICWPSRYISPLSGMRAPESALIRLDFPAPLSPITARISPGYNSRSLPSMATTRPYRLVRFLACRTGVIVSVARACRAEVASVVMLCPPRLRWRPAVRRSCLDLPDPLIEGDGDQYQHADGEALPDDLDAAELQAVAEDADDEGADQGADHAAPAAEEAGAAEHDGGDRVEVVLGADVRARRGEPADEDPPADRVEQTGDGVDGEQHPVGPDAREPGGFDVVAGGVDVLAPRRRAQRVEEVREQHQHD